MSTSPQPESIDHESATPAVRARPRSRFKRMNPAVKYTAVFVAVALVVIVGQIVLHALRTEPRDSRAIAQRELEVNVLQSGERVVNAVSVVRRTPIDYFRATHGVLALTNKRIVFLGLRPRDMLAPSDAPPTFEERDFPLDTAVSVTTGRAMALLTKGIVIRTPDETIRLGVPTASWPEAQTLAGKMTGARQSAQTVAKNQESLRKIADAEWKRAVEAWHKPQYHVVRGGDALGSIATQWNTTPEILRGLNKLPNNNIRVGQVLLVREAM